MIDPLARLREARKIGYLFSGGSARCVFQIGVVEELERLGLKPAICLGVSAGSWNAAAVAAGKGSLLRRYWKFFWRMPYFDFRNLLDEHSPFAWSRLHHRAFARYIGVERLRSSESTDLFVAVTRLRDKSSLIIDVRKADDPVGVLLASNYLPPFYTHAPVIDGERCGDGGFSNNAPYEFLFEQGCDVVVMMISKGESEGGIYRNADDYEHQIPAEYRDRIVVIRPRHRIPLRFVEHRWALLAPIADLGALRAREVLLGESHPATALSARGSSPTVYMARARRLARSFIGRAGR